MRKTTLYGLGSKLSLSRNDIDEILSTELGMCSQYSRSIMAESTNSYKAGTHYGTVSIKDFE
ncbi:MAG: hypothetical protein NTV74_02120 [Euryarchaeota archaeon]|nr:hypothetical protein [Euryarchaeota archaeon]